MEKPSLINRYPTLYHMAEAGSWPSICAHGLLSTSALLDHCGVTGPQRMELESLYRPDKVCLEETLQGRITLRDQKPMDEKRLIAAFQNGITPRQWRETLNSRVFFSAQAKPYRDHEHDALTLDTASSVNA
jgi:hypothetical protein